MDNTCGQCVHEQDVLSMCSDVSHLKSDVKDIKADLRDIYNLLKGNGKPGLAIEIALLKQSDSRKWWWLGVLSVSFIGVAFCVIKNAVVGP